MKTKMVYFMLAALSVGGFGMLAPNAVAGDNTYFEVLSRKAPMCVKADGENRTIETTTSYPVLIERTSDNAVLIERTCLMPVMLEKTSIAKPHHWPLSLGVWP